MRHVIYYRWRFLCLLIPSPCRYPSFPSLSSLPFLLTSRPIIFCFKSLTSLFKLTRVYSYSYSIHVSIPLFENTQSSYIPINTNLHLHFIYVTYFEQSDVPVMLLDVTNNDALLAQTPCEQNSANELLATYTFPSGKGDKGGNRMEIKIRTVEGQHGTLSAYIIPKTSPKTCQKISFHIKPLSLHEKVRT
jgi:hypothetical protein